MVELSAPIAVAVEVLDDDFQEPSLKNDLAWQKVFARTDILKEIEERGYFLISAKELQTRSDERQPRLMVKFDFDFQRPDLFKKHRLNILPLKRGQYVVFKDPDNTCYFNFAGPKNEFAMHNTVPISHMPSIDLEAFDTLETELCASECDAVDLAFASGLLQSYCQTGPLMPTKRGRFGSGKFLVRLPGCGEEILVDGAQIEVDSIYESEDAVVLIEAKRGFHAEFHTRQLYYPFKWLSSKTSKKIVPIFLCYSNGQFQLSEFAIGSDFGDIKLIRQSYFVIGNNSVAPGDIDSLLKTNASPVEPLSVAFPQADDMDKIVDVVSIVDAGFKDTPSLVDIFGFDKRQAGYYLAAAKYLGFLTKTCELTPLGEHLLSQGNRISRSKIILNCMFSRPAFRDAILHLKKENFDIQKVSKEEIIAMISAARTGEYEMSTLSRRADCVRSWLRWLLVNCDLC